MMLDRKGRHLTRIVLADDHKILREGIRRLLEDNNGFRIVGEADNGLQALEIVGKLHPDVLITDLRMPAMDGVELTRRVKESFSDISIVLLSMY